MANRRPDVSVFSILAAALVIGAAAWLRFADLGHKIIHADEAVQGWKTGLLLEGEGYAYDPTDHHGPTLYYLAVPIAQLRGEDSLNDLTVTTLRILPALAGVGVVALTAAGGFWLGGRGALAAALVAAASPMLVFYSRHFVQEMLLVLFSAAWVLALWRWLLGGRPAWLLIAGWALGLMIATKETWLIVVFATGMGSVAALWCDRGLRARAFSREAIVFGAGGLVAAAVVAAIIYTAAFSRPEVLGDVFKALLVGSERAGDGAGHAKPWSYYFTTLAWTRLRGFTYTEAGVFLLALASLPLAFRSPRGDSRTAASRFWLGYTGAMLMVYSLIPYKTIWLLCGAMHGLAMLAGLGVDTLLDRFRRPLSRSIVAIIAVGILADYAWQARRASTQDANRLENPYAYVETSPDILRLPKRLQAVRAAWSGPDAPVIKVGMANFWPLPWLLRGFDSIGWWTTPDFDPAADVLILDATWPEPGGPVWEAPHGIEIFGLRDGDLAVMHVRRDLWERSLEEPAP